MDLVMDVCPAQCTLVPDPPGVLTSSEGWDTIGQKDFLLEITTALREKGIRVSLFVDPDVQMVLGAHHVGADRVELYTGDYARNYQSGRDSAIKPHLLAAQAAEEAELGLNAGHDLNLHNLAFYRQQIPSLLEVSIGHALISDALYYGLRNAIGMYRRCLQLPERKSGNLLSSGA
jgi:pyridoxine 5-phosphate synthase